VADSRIAERAPLRILCQSDHGSCAACCGIHNFIDRSPAATRARLLRRTERVRTAWPDPAALAVARDALLAEERPQVLFAGLKVCPFAGFIDEPTAKDDGRVGCLLHPSRHPDGADLRDLAVYPAAICAGHFCAPHDWLRADEADLAQTARGLLYGRVVTDAGLVKAIARGLHERGGGASRVARLASADEAPTSPGARAAQATRAALDALWRTLLEAWPFVDPDPRRFGGFRFDGDDAVDRSLPSCLAGLAVDAAPWERTVLDAVGTRALSVAEAHTALATLRTAVDAVVAAAEVRA
jgi:hypothetical protein